MLVDDDLLEHKKLKNVLRKFDIDCSIINSYDGEQALYFLSENKHNLPCLILLDLNMPKMDGIEFLRKIKQDALLRKIPIVILTTSNASKDKTICFDLQIAGYMIKPIEFSEYSSLVKKITSYWQSSEFAY